MRLVFYSNYLNHHQVLIADELYKILGKEYSFVATLPTDVSLLKGGEDYSKSRTYCLRAFESQGTDNEAKRLARKADVCVFGASSQVYAIERAMCNPTGLSFEVGERWLKRGLLNVLSPVLRQWWLNYMRYYRKANFFKLCSSAFCAKDDEKLGCYRGKHFKWGYFTEVLENNQAATPSSECDNIVTLMWCARFIDWKHPELAIWCAKLLKEADYQFLLNMFGDGILRERMIQQVAKLGLNDYVKFCGNVPNTVIQETMRNSDIFLFTSDKQEGWGAVANEAMAAGCCLVGSNEIGAIPYLVNDCKNGLIFNNRSIDSLYTKVKYLIDNPNVCKTLASQGCNDMIEMWSPKCAARNLLQLIDNLPKTNKSPIIQGPCSEI